MAKSQKTKRSGGAHPDALPEPARSMAREVRKDVSKAEDKGKDRPGSDAQAAEQMEEWVTSRAPSARKPQGST